MPVFPDVQEDAQGDGAADIAEVEQVEDVVLRQPQRDGDRLKDGQDQDGQRIFFHHSSPAGSGPGETGVIPGSMITHLPREGTGFSPLDR